MKNKSSAIFAFINNNFIDTSVETTMQKTLGSIKNEAEIFEEHNKVNKKRRVKI